MFHTYISSVLFAQWTAMTKLLNNFLHILDAIHHHRRALYLLFLDLMLLLVCDAVKLAESTHSTCRGACCFQILPVCYSPLPAELSYINVSLNWAERPGKSAHKTTSNKPTHRSFLSQNNFVSPAVFAITTFFLRFDVVNTSTTTA